MEGLFQYFMPVKLCVGAGESRKVSQYIKGENIFIISDPFLYQNGLAQTIGDSLAGKNVKYFFEVEPNPSCESVDKAAGQAREMKADCVIGLGGGSALDVSKIVSCLVTNEGSIYDYYAGGSRQLKKREITLMCIPTTAGTGSEVTNVGVYTNKKAGVKMPMVNDEFWADYAVVDYELTYTLPTAVTASTGMDAFCHAIEAYWNKGANPVCDMLAIGAMELVLNNIETACQQPQDDEARAKMMEASLIAGIAFSQTRTTGVHAISFPLTTEFHANHGTACAITLPAFIKISEEKQNEKMKRLARYLGYNTIDELANGIETIMKKIGLPVRLSQLGVQETDLQHITEVGLGAVIMQLTPATMNEETVYQLLQSIL
jgi:Alcohol dehydrogenase, class IV